MQSIESFPHIHSYLFHNARSFPKRAAILSPTVDMVDYETLARIVATYARRLQLRGVSRSSCLAVNLTGGISMIAVAYAASIIGCRWVQVDKITLDNASLFTCTHQVHDNVDLPVDKDHVIFVDAWRENADIFPEELPQFGLEGYVGKKAIWRIASSSGSTGRPKFMQLTEEIILARCVEPLAYVQGDVPIIASLFPSYSSPGLVTLLRVFTAAGTAIVRPTIPYLVAKKADFVIGSPAQLTGIIQNASPSDQRVPYAITTGGLLNARFVEHALHFFDALVNRFGSTETGHVSSGVIREKSEGPFSVGHPDRDAIVEIVDEQDQPLGPNQQGRVRVKKPVMVSSYLGQIAEDQNAFQAGWFYSGDLGYRTDGGELYLVGRAKEQFNLGGVKLSADDLDEKLNRVTGVRDCISFTSMDERGIHRLYAAIVKEPEHTEQDIVDRIVKDYAPSVITPAVPEAVYFVPVAPRNDNGKATRHLAADLVRGVASWPVKERIKKPVTILT